MPTENFIYRKILRLREKRRRLDRRLAVLEKKLAGKKFRWRGCSSHRNRK